MKEIEYYRTESGKVPFQEWLSKLDIVSQSRIVGFVNRVAQGAGRNNVKSVGQGVFEIKLYFGPGYRVYFGKLDGAVILLLAGGDKDSQFMDIRQAQIWWRQYGSK